MILGKWDRERIVKWVEANSFKEEAHAQCALSLVVVKTSSRTSLISTRGLARRLQTGWTLSR